VNKILYPIKAGLNHKWKPLDLAIRATGSGAKYSFILEPITVLPNGFQVVDCLNCSGTVNSESPENLLTVEGYKKHCDYMQNDWSGRQYKEALELADSGMPFITPDWWEEAVRCATGQHKNVEFREESCGGVFDGNRVISDADPGL